MATSTESEKAVKEREDQCCVFVGCTRDECLSGRVPFTVLTVMKARVDSAVMYCRHRGTRYRLFNDGPLRDLQRIAADSLTEGAGDQSVSARVGACRSSTVVEVRARDGGGGVWLSRNARSSLFVSPWKAQASHVASILRCLMGTGEFSPRAVTRLILRVDAPGDPTMLTMSINNPPARAKVIKAASERTPAGLPPSEVRPLEVFHKAHWMGAPRKRKRREGEGEGGEDSGPGESERRS